MVWYVVEKLWKSVVNCGKLLESYALLNDSFYSNVMIYKWLFL